MYLCEICVFFSEKVYKKCRFSFFKKLPAMFVRMLDANFKNTQQTPKSKEFLIFFVHLLDSLVGLENRRVRKPIIYLLRIIFD